MRRRVVLAALAVAVCSAGAPVDTQSTPSRAPMRIVSTSPSITETLFALGLGDRVVGVSTYCRYPAEAAKLPKVGTFLEPDAEIIARLRPDLVFVHLGPNDVPRQLATLGIPAVTVDRGTLASIYTTTEAIGKAAGVPQRARDLVAQIRRRLETIRAHAATRPARRVLIVVGRQPSTLTDLIGVGHGSFLDDLIGVAGGVNVLGDPALPEYPRISMETVIRLEPDLIVDAGDMGETVEEHRRRQPLTDDLHRVWQREAPDWSIFVQLRVSRTLLGLFAGASLALGGALYQVMLRDSLATPYTLGVSSGASLGAVIAIVSGWRWAIAIPPAWIGALVGGAAALTLSTGAMTRAEGLSPHRLLLAGIAMNSVNSALILLIYGLSGISTSLAITRWLIGSLDAIPLVPLAAFVVLVVALAVVIIRQGRSWTLLSVGEEWAGTRGVDVQRLAWFGYVTGSILAAVTVAVAGPIGFVGLIVPHVVRERVSPDARLLMPCAFCFGGVLLAACDALGRTVLAPAEVPAGAITACIGGPYLVWIVRRR